MNTQKLKEITKGRTDIFQNGRKVASFDKRSDINLLSTYATKGKLRMTLGPDRVAMGRKEPPDCEIAEVIVFDKALSDEDMAFVHASLRQLTRNRGAEGEFRRGGHRKKRGQDKIIADPAF